MFRIHLVTCHVSHLIKSLSPQYNWPPLCVVCPMFYIWRLSLVYTEEFLKHVTYIITLMWKVGPDLPSDLRIRQLLFFPWLSSIILSRKMWQIQGMGSAHTNISVCYVSLNSCPAQHSWRITAFVWVTFLLSLSKKECRRYATFPTLLSLWLSAQYPFGPGQL